MGAVGGPLIAQSRNAVQIVAMGTVISSSSKPYVSGDSSASVLPDLNDVRQGLEGTIPGPVEAQVLQTISIESVSASIAALASGGTKSATFSDIPTDPKL